MWRNNDVVFLRIKKKHVWKPLLALVVFVAGWYAALMTTIDFSAVSPPWRAVWLALKTDPPLLVVFLLPLFPVIMVIRDTLGQNRLVFNRRERAIYRRKKRLMGFDDVNALLIRMRAKKSARAAAELSLQSNRGRNIFISRCESYESCLILAQEIATVVSVPVKTG